MYVAHSTESCECQPKHGEIERLTDECGDFFGRSECVKELSAYCLPLSVPGLNRGLGKELHRVKHRANTLCLTCVQTLCLTLCLTLLSTLWLILCLNELWEAMWSISG